MEEASQYIVEIENKFMSSKREFLNMLKHLKDGDDGYSKEMFEAIEKLEDFSSVCEEKNIEIAELRAQLQQTENKLRETEQRFYH